jgi:hypothetical protein
MADKKISALTGASTPLAGTEVLPIVQSGSTVKVAVSDLTAGRSVSGTSFVPTGSTIPANGLYLPAANSVGLATNTTNAIYVDSSQNVFVGASASPSGLYSVKTASVTTSGAAFYGVNNGATSYYTLALWNKATTGDRRLVHFLAGATETEVGSIVYNGAVTVYATTSDHRLKTVIGAVSGSGERIDALQPVEYTWNSNGQSTRGFLAHQFQEVYADSVTGTKDAVNADGNPAYQSMQASTPEVIADLVAEIQSLRKRLTTLEAKTPA